VNTIDLVSSCHICRRGQTFRDNHTRAVSPAEPEIILGRTMDQMKPIRDLFCPFGGYEYETR